jgi:WD40 repeat protein
MAPCDSRRLPAAGRSSLSAGHHDRVHGVAFSPDGPRLAAASADGVVRIWETGLQDEDELERRN